MIASELQLPPDVAYVGLARLLVTSAARMAAMAEERIEDLRIAVSEATTNAVLAHQSSQPSGQVVLQFGVTPDKTFQVTVLDTGPGYVVSPAPDLPQRDWTSEQGLGVTLLRGLADEVEFLFGDANEVHVRFTVELLTGDLPYDKRADA